MYRWSKQFFNSPLKNYKGGFKKLEKLVTKERIREALNNSFP
jgi:hypothetical protein